ncbi:unnamed protein product [Durusdinium trenchii]|uniref:Uncharacterized protein n=1 Tax=Durusdinium trenchii TaxID=1381693 RepID=A0ABP0KQE6_9DINO
MGWSGYKGTGQKGYYWSGAWPKTGKGEDKKELNKDKSKGKKDGDIEFPAYSSSVQSSSSASTPSVDSQQIKEAVAAYLVEHGLQTSEEAAKVLENGPLTQIQAEQKSLNSRKKATQKLEKLKARLVAKKKAWLQFQERLDAHRKSQKEIYEAEVKELEKEIEAATQDLETMLRETGRFEPGDLTMSPEVLGAENLELKTELLASRRALTELTDRFNAYLVQHGETPATPVGPAFNAFSPQMADTRDRERSARLAQVEKMKIQLGEGPGRERSPRRDASLSVESSGSAGLSKMES